MKIAPTFTARTLVLDFGPWLVYGLISATGQRGPAYAGGLIAFVVCQIIPRWWVHPRKLSGLKVLDWVSLLFFLAGTVFTLGFHSSLFSRDGSVLIWGLFAAVAWGSLLIGAPFTAEYAREAVPSTVWESAGFRRVSVVITAVWGTVFALNAFLSVFKSSGSSMNLQHLFQVLPFVGTIFGIVFTNRYPHWVSRRQKAQPEG